MLDLSRLTVAELLFDLDGTLIDSIAAIEHAWQEWAAIESVELHGVRNFHGRTARDLVSSLLPPHRVTAAVDRLRDLEQHPRVRVAAIPGAVALLATLPADRWTIVTSAARSVALARIAAAGLPSPSLLISGDDVSRGKPDPEPYCAARRPPVGKWPAVAFEDTASGLRSARAAGCITVGVLGTEPRELLRPHADAVIASIADIGLISVSESTIVLALTQAGDSERDKDAVAASAVAEEEMDGYDG